MNIEIYETDKGKVPFRDFMLSLAPKMQAKALRNISILEEYGANLREPFSKHLKDGIFELRIQRSPFSIRILYFYFDENTAIVTNGFVKKTQKTPRAEIQKAQEYRMDWLRRKNEI